MLILVFTLVLLAYHARLYRRLNLVQEFIDSLSFAMRNEIFQLDLRNKHVPAIASPIISALKYCKRRGVLVHDGLVMLWRFANDFLVEEKSRHALLSLYLQRMLLISCLAFLCRAVAAESWVSVDGIALESISIWFVWLGYFFLKQTIYRSRGCWLQDSIVRQILVDGFLLDQFSKSVADLEPIIDACRQHKRRDIRQGLDRKDLRRHEFLSSLQMMRQLCAHQRTGDSLLPICELGAGGLILLCTFLQWPIAN